MTKKILLSILFFILFTNAHYGQYTSIINASKPGKTITPYAVGTGVFQIENSTLYKQFDNKSTQLKSDGFNNDLTVHYGFWLERLEAVLRHQFTYSDFTTATNKVNTLGTEKLSFGFKYLLYEHTNKESPELKKSWKRRYGFKYNGLIPSIGVAAYVNAPFNHSNFNNNKTSVSLSLMAQNNINKKLRINNQFDYNNIGGNFTEFVYSISSSFVVAKRWNPYIQFRYHNLSAYSFCNLGAGTPFLVNRNFALAAYFDTAIGSKVSGQEFGVNASFRIDHHKDKWKIKKERLEELKQLEKNADKKEDEFEDGEFVDDADNSNGETVDNVDGVETKNIATDENVQEPKKEKKKKVKKKKRKTKKEKRKEAEKKEIEDILTDL